MVSGVGRSAARNEVELGRTVERCTAAGAIQHARVRERGVDTIRAPHCKTHLFVAEKEEDLVFFDRPADCSAPLLQAAVRFRLIRGRSRFVKRLVRTTTISRHSPPGTSKPSH